MLHPKTTAAGASGAVTTLLIYIASIFGVTIPGEVGAAIATILAFAAAYLTKSTPPAA